MIEQIIEYLKEFITINACYMLCFKILGLQLLNKQQWYEACFIHL